MGNLGCGEWPRRARRGVTFFDGFSDFRGASAVVTNAVDLEVLTMTGAWSRVNCIEINGIRGDGLVAWRLILNVRVGVCR